MTNLWYDGTATIEHASDLENRIRNGTENERTRKLMEAQGFTDAKMLRGNCGTASAVASGQVFANLMALCKTDTVTLMTQCIENTPSGVTLSRFGIYNAAGTLVASSANVAAQFASSGLKEVLLSSPYSPGADVMVLMAYIHVGAGTQPSVLRNVGGANVLGAKLSGASFAMGNQMTAQTDLPNTLSLLTSVSLISFIGWR